MSRPETLQDLESEEDVSFGSIDLARIATDPVLMKGYTAFIDAVQKAGATVKAEFNRVELTRPPSLTELKQQLKDAQNTWDYREKLYNQLRDVGALEHSFERSYAEQWAKAEGMPFPPEHEEITSFDAVIRDIDSAVS